MVKEIKVKFLGIDGWDRKVYQNIETKQIYKDVDCINYSGQYYTSDSFDSEPDFPLRENIIVKIIE